MPVTRNSNLCDNYSDGVIKDSETPARRGWFRFRTGKTRESFLEGLTRELEVEGPVEMQSVRE